MPLLITTIKQKAKRAAVEGDQNVSITTQLVKQKAKWEAIEDGDHNASITTHTKKNRKKNNKKKKQKAMREPQSYKELQRVRTAQDHRLIVEPRWAKPKTYHQAPTHWLKFYEKVVIESEARIAVVLLKSETYPSTMVGLIKRHAVCRIISRQ